MAIRGGHVFGPHLRLFGVMLPFDGFRGHVAIWPFAENYQAGKNCSWLIKSSYGNVISWPGLPKCLSEDFMRPDGHMATWSLKRARWPRGSLRIHVAIWLFSKPCGHLALCRKLSARENCSWLIKSSNGNVIFWPGLALGLSEGFMRPDGHMATWLTKGLDGHMLPERATWPSSPQKGPDGHRGHQMAR
jgi:hypothetical protein